MRFDRLLVAAGISGAVLVHPAAFAHQTVYSGPLLGASEFPAVVSPGGGTATVTVDFDSLMMRVQASFSDLIGNTSVTHIHCCTVDAFSGNAGVATQTPSFTDFPQGVKAGTYDHVFDMSLGSSYNAAFITANGGSVSGAFAALTAGMDAGKSYLNIHTTVFQPGEIRALLSPVPEPSGTLMMIAGMALAGVVVRARRRRR